MATDFPTDLDSFGNPTATDKTNNPDHATQHANVNDAVEAIETKLGKDSSTVEASHDYKLTPRIITLTDGATVTIDLAKRGIHQVTLGGNRTLAVSNETVGQVFILSLLQDGTGSRTVTWFSTVAWSGGSAPTLTTTINKRDVFAFIVLSAGNYAGFVVGQNV